MRQIHQIPCSFCVCATVTWQPIHDWLDGGCSEGTLPSLAWAKFPWSISVCAHNSWGEQGKGKEVPPPQCCAEQCLLYTTLCLDLHDGIKHIFSVSLLLIVHSYTHAQPLFWDTAGVAVLEKNLALLIHYLQLPFLYSNGHGSFPLFAWWVWVLGICPWDQSPVPSTQTSSRTGSGGGEGQTENSFLLFSITCWPLGILPHSSGSWGLAFQGLM